jgi:hypothetical protein
MLVAIHANSNNPTIRNNPPEAPINDEGFPDGYATASGRKGRIICC